MCQALDQTLAKVSEYDQEIPQSKTAYQPTAPWRRATEHLTIQMEDNNSKATSFFFLFKMIAKLESTQSNA